MRTFVPQVKREQICKICGGQKKLFKHQEGTGLYAHPFQPRLETIAEAYYRAGYSDGSRETSSRIHWGLGWD